MPKGVRSPLPQNFRGMEIQINPRTEHPYDNLPTTKPHYDETHYKGSYVVCRGFVRWGFVVGGFVMWVCCGGCRGTGGDCPTQADGHNRISSPNPNRR